MLRSIGRAVGKCHRFSGMYSKNMHRNMQTIAISSQSDIPSRHSLSWSVLAGALILTAGCVSQNESHCASEGNIFTKAEISKHTTKEVGIWVTYGDGVYDVTDFVANHPGGTDKIMLAAGTAVEPYWRVYRQHYNSKLPLELLEGMKIGTLHPDDIAAAKAIPFDNSDPYSKDPVMSPVLNIHQTKPMQAEPPGSLLAHTWKTPADLQFVRNHHPVPVISPDDHEVEIKVPVEQGDGSWAEHSVRYSVAQLKSDFKSHKVVSTIQCGGNRRAGMDEASKTSGIPWGIGAIHTAEWTGVRLRDVLVRSGFKLDRYCSGTDLDHEHVQFAASDGMGASVPIYKVCNPRGDVLLAYEMDGVPIPAEHGAPLRVIVPGHVGVRNVKWVSTVTVSKEEAHGTWQRGIAYKGFGPSLKTTDGLDVEKIPSLQEQPVTSSISVPKVGSSLFPGVVTVQGYAYSGGGRGIVRVDVSADGGKTWKSATLNEGHEQPMDRAWAWTLWECDFELPDTAVNSEVEFVSKATDAAYNVQPDSVQGIWNLRGINNNSWYRLKATVVEEPKEP